MKESNGITLFENTQNVNYGSEIDLNVDDYIVEGTNTITIRITGSESLFSTSISYSIIALNLVLTDTFNIAQLIEAGNTLDIHWYIEGSGLKYIVWYIDNNYLGSDSILESKTDRIKQIPTVNLEDGKHTLQYYAYIDLGGGNKFYSDILYRDFIVDHSDSAFSSLSTDYATILTAFSCPIEGVNILIDGDGTSLNPIIIRGLVQYESKNIKYCSYYKDQTATKNVKITLENKVSEFEVENLTTVHTYDIRPVGEGETPMTISLLYDEQLLDTIYFNSIIAQSPYNIENITSNLVFAFSGSDRTNDSPDKDHWSFTNINNIEYTGILSGFNWIANSGWNNGRLIISNGASFITDYAPFYRPLNNPISDTGYTFEIEFKTTRVLNEETSILDLRNEVNSKGLYITNNEVIFSSKDENTVSTKYKPEENIRVSIVINPIGGSSSYKGLIMMYIDGVLTSIKNYTNTDSFASDKYFGITGSADAIIELKQVRCYDRALSPSEILNNFILYRDTAEELMEVYDRNNIYVNGIMSKDKLAEKTPIIVLTGSTDDNIDPLSILYGFGRDNKSTYVRMEKLEVINLEHPELNMILEDVSIRCQGTSSMDYPIKNFRFYTQKDGEDKQYNPKDTADHNYTTKMWVGGLNPKEDGVELTGKSRKYSFKQGSQPVKTWCLKADYAESSSTHNTGIARLWNQALRDVEIPASNVDSRYYIQPESGATNFKVCRTLAQRAAAANNDFPYDVRTTVDGFPIVLFYHKKENDPLTFVGRYNWNNDKSTESVYGFCDIPGFDDLNVECWEVVEGDMPCNCFYDISDWNESTRGWSESFEARYPDDGGKPTEAYRARNFITIPYGETSTKDYIAHSNCYNSVVISSGTLSDRDYVAVTDCYDSEDTLKYHSGDTIPSGTTFEGNWLVVGDTIVYSKGAPIPNGTVFGGNWKVVDYGALYTVCKWINGLNGAARVGENGMVVDDISKMNLWRLEKWDHLDVYKMAAYYVYLMRFGAVDQVVKNAMFTTEDGQHWYYINYDNDTINGVRNDGALRFDYRINRQSKDPDNINTYCYAGHDSVLWNNLEADEEFMNIVKLIDDALYKSGVLTYSNVIDMFNNKQSASWAERTHNEDYIYKYIGPYINNGDAMQFAKLQGPRKSHRQWWLSNRFALYDALNGVGSYKSNFISIKPNGNQRVRPGQGVTIVPSSGDQIFGYSFGNAMKETGRRAPAGQEIRFNFSTADQIGVGAQPMFYNAVYMQSFDCSDISDVVNEIRFDDVNSDAFDSTLTSIILGNPSSRSNTSSTVNISGLGKVKYLESFQMNKYEGITVISLKDNRYLKKVDVRGCNSLVNIELPVGAPITELHYPGSIQTLNLEDYVDLASFDIDNGGQNLSNITVKNCPKLTSSHAFLIDWLDNKTTPDSSCVVYMDHVNWTNVSVEEIEKLMAFVNNGGHLTLLGKMEVASGKLDAVLAHKLINTFGEGVFKSSSAFYVKVNASILLEGPTSILEGDSAEYSIFYIGNDEDRPSGNKEFRIITSPVDLREGTSVNSSTGVVSTTENGAQTKSFELRAMWGSLIGDMSIEIVKRKYPSNDLREVSISGKNRVSLGDTLYTIKYSDPTINGAITVQWSTNGDLSSYITLIPSKVDGEDRCIVRLNSTPSETVMNGTLTATLYKSNYPDPKPIVGTDGLVSLTIGYKDNSIAISSATNPFAMAAVSSMGTSVVPNPDILTVLEASRILTYNVQPGDDFTSSIFRTGGFYNNCTNFDEFEYFTGLSYIPVYLFYGCSKLENIILPNNITSIKGYAFYGCSSLKSITIPANVTEIGDYAFCACENLETVIFEGDNITNIGGYVFQGCSKLKNIVLPSHLTTINTRAFSGCSSIENIIIPDSVTSIEDGAFYGCSSLESVTIGSGVLNIKSNAFQECISLQSIIIPNNVTSIGAYAFYGCSSMESAVVGNGVTTIGEYSFADCGALESISFGNSISVFSYCLCSGCVSLKNVRIGSGLSNPSYLNGINSEYGSGLNAFQGCINIESIIIDSNNNKFYDGSESGGANCIIYKDGSNNILYLGCKTSIIPSTCTQINSYAFDNLPTITNINIPNKIKSIGTCAFRNCSNLTTVNFENTNSDLTTIGTYAFQGCASLSEVVIPDEVTNLSDNAFQDCTELVAITIGDKVTTIGDFVFYNCSGLKNITIPNRVVNIGQYCFYNCSNLESITFEETSVLTNITSGLFRGCSKLASISIPDSVTNIQSQAFYGCSGLLNIHIGAGVQTISSDALRSYSPSNQLNLSNISVDSNNTAFSDGTNNGGSNCIVNTNTNSLILGCRNTTIPSNARSIGEYAFSCVGGISILTLPSNIGTIGSYAFQYCNDMMKINSTGGSTSIGEYAFYHCSNLVVVTLGVGVSVISSYAFSTCENLRTIISYNAYPPTLTSNPFYNDNIMHIYVEDEVVRNRYAGQWKEYADKIEFPIPVEL